MLATQEPDAPTTMAVFISTGLGAFDANTNELNEKAECLKDNLQRGVFDQGLIDSMVPLLAESKRQQKILSNVQVHMMGYHTKKAMSLGACQAAVKMTLAAVEGFDMKDCAAEQARQEAAAAAQDQAAAAAQEEKMKLVRRVFDAAGITFDDMQRATEQQ